MRSFSASSALFLDDEVNKLAIVVATVITAEITESIIDAFSTVCIALAAPIDAAFHADIEEVTNEPISPIEDNTTPAVPPIEFPTAERFFDNSPNASVIVVNAFVPLFCAVVTLFCACATPSNACSYDIAFSVEPIGINSPF